MSDCIYCGEPAGIFNNEHKECKAESIIFEKIEALGKQALELFVKEKSCHYIGKSIAEQADILGLDDEYWKTIYIKAYIEFTDRLKPELLNDQIENKLENYLAYFRISEKELLEHGQAENKFEKIKILKGVYQGSIIAFDTQIKQTLNFKKDETLIYLFEDIPYIELQTKREFLGSSMGGRIGSYNSSFSMREYRGKTIEHLENTVIGVGVFAITNEHLYFQSNQKSFKVKINKIVSVNHASDGVTIQLDAAKSIPQIFMIDSYYDSWFVHQLILNLSNP